MSRKYPPKHFWLCLVKFSSPFLWRWRKIIIFSESRNNFRCSIEKDSERYQLESLIRRSLTSKHSARTLPSRHSITLKEEILTSWLISTMRQWLCSLLNKHAPLRSREIILRPHAPWFNNELRELKREKRRLERKYVNTNLTVHKEMYQMICTEYTKHIVAAKTEYFRKKVEDASHDQLFKFVGKFLNVKKAPILPKHESSKELAERFSEHFQMKIAGIRRELSASSLSSLTIEDHETCPAPPLSCFQPVSSSEIKRFIMSTKTKSCQLDPVPTWILKGCTD